MSPFADALRDAQPAQFFATLFVPVEQRDAVMVLRAFSAEMARIPWRVSEPMLGEIRFQWWREVLDGQREGEAAANPLAASLLHIIRDHGLPVAMLQGLIDARIEDLYADPPPSLHDLEGRLGETHAVPYRLAAMICDANASSAVADVAGHGGVAEGLIEILAHWPSLLQRARVMLPQDMMARYGVTREIVLAGTEPTKTHAAFMALLDHAVTHYKKAAHHLGGLHQAEAVAFLPLCLLASQIKILQRGVPVSPLGLPQWRMQWDLWRGSRRAIKDLF